MNIEDIKTVINDVLDRYYYVTNERTANDCEYYYTEKYGDADGVRLFNEYREKCIQDFNALKELNLYFPL